MCIFPESNDKKCWSPRQHLRNSASFQTRMNKRRTSWKLIWAMLKYKNECHRQLGLKNLNLLKQSISIIWKNSLCFIRKYMNWYNSVRFFPDISKKMQKEHNFWQFKDYKLGRRYENKTNDPFFHLLFQPKLFGNLIFIFETFHLVTLCSIVVWKISEFWKY